jgi:hypothetical protein
MWHATMAALAALLQQHLLFDGLGGVITAVVGGVIAAVVMRANKRNAARPAPIAQPAPDSRRSTPPASYGDYAPPTSPARRLYSGPIVLSEPTPPQSAADDEEHTPSASLFNPDAIVTGVPVEPSDLLAVAPHATAPILRSNSSIVAAWRDQAAATPSNTSIIHTALWSRTLFGRPELDDMLSTSYATSATMAAPPIWHMGFVGAGQREASVESPPLAAMMEPPLGQPAPIWASWLHTPVASPLGATEGHLRDELTAEAASEPEPPIWPSFLRPE